MSLTDEYAQYEIFGRTESNTVRTDFKSVLKKRTQLNQGEQMVKSFIIKKSVEKQLMSIIHLNRWI